MPNLKRAAVLRDPASSVGQFAAIQAPPALRMMSHMAGSLKRRGSTGRAGIIVTLWRCDRRPEGGPLTVPLRFPPPLGMLATAPRFVGEPPGAVRHDVANQVAHVVLQISDDVLDDVSHRDQRPPPCPRPALVDGESRAQTSLPCSLPVGRPALLSPGRPSSLGPPESRFASSPGSSTFIFQPTWLMTDRP